METRVQQVLTLTPVGSVLCADYPLNFKGEGKMTGRAEMSGQPPLIFVSPPAPPCWQTLFLHSSSELPAYANLLSLSQSHIAQPGQAALKWVIHGYTPLFVCVLMLTFGPPKNPAAAALLVHSAGVLSVMHCTNLISHIKKKKPKTSGSEQ